MSVSWKKLLVQTIFWLVVEIVLNFLGLDNLADYSEFIFEKNFNSPSSGVTQAISLAI
ncbi:hypothetical protein [Dapis sp. BLCC M229]|uniref:hypothetical protein n=1 Tax=Dapis sp. BLCC M229 TaxID=3400188 RepID=UPI003CF924B0